MNAARTRSRMSRVAVLLAVAWVTVLASSGCSVQRLQLPGRDRDPRALPDPSDDRATRVEDAQVTMKRVTAKEVPTTLIADDRTRCIVPQKGYDETRIGDYALSVWRDP